MPIERYTKNWYGKMSDARTAITKPEMYIHIAFPNTMILVGPVGTRSFCMLPTTQP